MQRKKNIPLYVARVFEQGEILQKKHLNESSAGRFYSSVNISKLNRFALETPAAQLIEGGVLKFNLPEMSDGKKMPTQNEAATFHQAFYRIIAGLMLYFNTLPGPEYEKLAWKKSEAARITTPQDDSVDCIANEELVCAVAYNNSCAHEDQDSNESKKRNSSCGWRHGPYEHPGYWRREAGQGNNPLAPRTKWVKPYSVHKELLPQGTIPVGLEKVI
jgi:hypothetical protein